MASIQLIEYRDRPVAIVVRGEAIVSERVAPADVPIVAGMCVYAIEIETGERPGPYRDQDAEAFALSGRERALRRERRANVRGHRRTMLWRRERR